MQGKDIQVGGHYSTAAGHRVEILAALGSGLWQVRYLDPPRKDVVGSTSSRDLTEAWRPAHQRALEKSYQTTSMGATPHQLERGRLLRLGAQFSQQLEGLDPSHPVEVRQVEPHRPSTPGAPGPGRVTVTLPEPVLASLLRQLGSEPGSLEGEDPGASSGLAQLL